jgi:hypothetical protein
VSPDEVDALSLKDRRGAIVAQVPPGPAATAGVEPGDVIVEFNGKPVNKSDDLPQIVAATAPGTTVPVKVIRDGKERTFNVRVEELSLDAEAARQADATDPGGDTGAGFGITLNNVTPRWRVNSSCPQGARGAVVTEVEPDSPAARVLQPGDVILQVNRKPVANANEASTALRAVPSGPCGRHADHAARTGAVRHRSQGISGAPRADSRPHPDGAAPSASPSSWDISLYHPDLGYYARAAQKTGRAGDFFTSVDVGPIFGELLAKQFAEMWQILRSGSDPRTGTGVRPQFDLVEAGAGSGRLARDILDAAQKHHPDFYPAIRLSLVEQSQTARESAAQNAWTPQRACWHTAEPPCPRTCRASFTRMNCSMRCPHTWSR